MRSKKIILVLILFIQGITGSFAFAGTGHDHQDEKPMGIGAGIPRFYAVSEDFELVGLIKDLTVTLYLDHFSTNLPVLNGEIEVDVDGQKYQASKKDDGTFEIILKSPLKSEGIVITIAIKADDKTDLLITEYDYHEETKLKEKFFNKYVLFVLIGLGTILMFVGNQIFRNRNHISKNLTGRSK